MRIFTLLTVLFFSQFVLSQNLEYKSFLIDQTLKEDANAVVRLDEIDIHLNSIQDMLVRKKRVVTVLNKLGDNFVHTREWYNNSVKILNIQAIVYDQFGNELDKFKQKDFKDISAVGGGTLYSDSRVLYLEYTPITYPYTIEFTVETKTQNTGYIPLWYFLDGYLISTEKSKYSINYTSPELKPILKEKNLENINVKKTETENSIIYEASNIPAIKYESLSPSFNDFAPQVVPRMVNFNYEGYIGNVNSWNDIGLWMYTNLIQGQDNLTESTKSKVHSLIANVTDDLEKAKIIYKYVQDNTRYISVQVGIGGLQPISAIEVDRVKYGDCKGLSNYTKALLKEAGVTSYYTHVESGNDKVSFESDFPDLWAGDHVILAIPYNDKLYWIDCTSQIHPFGFIGDFTDGRKVLLIKPDGGELVTTTAYINEQNSQKINATYSLSEDNTIDANIVIKTKGIQYDNHFPIQDNSEDDIIKHYKENWSSINNLNIKKFNFDNDTENVEFIENINVSATNYGTKSGERILFTVNAFNNNDYLPKRYRNRKLPLEIQRGFLDDDEFLIHIPEGYKVEALPNAKEIENEYGSYAISFEKNSEEKTIVYKRKLFIKEGNYPKEKYDDYRNFRKEISNSDNAKIVLIKE
tara:strand:- start:3197 stop:5107 length:1911 start_codon:yes stop_codon:yes gene_type:complete